MLTNPRTIANLIHSGADIYKNTYSNFLPHFAQFVDHDMTLTSLTSTVNGEPVKCSCEDKHNPDCINIPMTKEDVLNHDQKCMVTPRSSASFKRLDCKLGQREQLNMLTHWLDMSQTYGNDYEKSKKLRTFNDGMLLSSKIDNFKREYLPYDLKGKCANIQKQVPCFQAGDLRSNQNLLLTALQLVFLREHNRIAELLPKINALKYGSNDEMIYQEARRINIAQYQHIIYAEFLPALLGKQALSIYELEQPPNEYGYFMGYNEQLYPSVSIEFSTAAYRFGHSLVRPTLGVADINYKNFHQVQLNDAVFNPMGAFEHGGLDSYLRGSLMQSADWYDPYVNDYLNNHLFEGLNKNLTTHRFSLPALNVNRGRDHGIQGYTSYRTLCGLSNAQTFDDLDNVPRQVREKLKRVYKSVHDIDLFTGGTSEYPIDGGVIGPVFACN